MSFEKVMKPTPKLSVNTGLMPKLSLVPNKPAVPGLAKPAGLRLPPKPVGIGKLPPLPKPVIKETKVEPVVETVEKAKETVVEAKAAEETVVPVVEAKAEETVAATEDVTAAIASEQVVTEDKSKKKSSKRTPAKKEKAVSNDPKLTSAPALASAVKTLMEDNNIEIPKSTCSFAVATGILFPVDISEMWQDGFYEEVEQRMSEIAITDDMNPSAVRVLLSKIDDLYSMIRLEHSRVKGIYESFSRGDSYIDRVKALHSVGTNAEERRRASITAAMQYDTNGQKINMYDVGDGFRRQYIYLQGIMDQLDFKRQCLVTVGGTLRTESSL